MKLTNYMPVTAYRNTGKKIFLAAVALGSMLLLSCSTDSIFASIEREVKLKEPSLRGIVTSLVAVNNNLYAANGYLYTRTGGTGDWNSISTGLGDRCAMVATDATSVYALFTNKDGENGEVYRLNGSSWEKVSGISNAVYISSGFGGIFAFAGPEKGPYTAYRFTGTAAGSSIAQDLAEPVGSAGNYFATTAGVYTAAGTLVPESPKDLRGITTNGTDAFVMTEGDVYRLSGPTWTKVDHSVPKPTGIAWLGGGSSGKNMILISGASGYGEVLLAADGTLQSYQEPGSNDSSSIPPANRAQYQNSIDKWATYRIFAITSATISASSHTPYALYAGVADTNYAGLWSFYPSDSTPNWNRE